MHCVATSPTTVVVFAAHDHPISSIALSGESKPTYALVAKVTAVVGLMFAVVRATCPVSKISSLTVVSREIRIGAFARQEVVEEGLVPVLGPFASVCRHWSERVASQHGHKR